MKKPLPVSSPALAEARRISKLVDLPAGSLTILHDVSIAICSGETVALMGPSGSGKSTLLRLLGGLDVPSDGEVHVCGVELSALSADDRAEFRLRHVGYVFQEFNLLSTLTAAENVACPLEILGIPWRTARHQAADALARVGLAGKEERFPDELSGGERQRVAVARATVGESRVVLADEPTGALDSKTAEPILQLLRETAEAALIVTHDPAVAAQADRVVHILDGRLRGEVAPSQPAAR
jgi:putative ABC transport system ATP-binding protein